MNDVESRVADLRVAELHGALGDPALNSMNFLNEVSIRFPAAISLAAGRPCEDFLEVEDVHRYLRVFTDHLRGLGHDEASVRRTLLQYGRTKGIVHELVARNLRVDEGITADPESIVVTVGCQEAMFLVLRALRMDERDVVLAVSPTYVGLTGAARLVDMPVLPVDGGVGGVDFDDLDRQLAAAREAGLRPRALYLVPDFANPSGLSLDLAARRRLLAVADAADILLLEDNPYGLFHGDSERLPTLKSLDTQRKVVYLGSFAKTGLPGARVGYLVADQRVVESDGGVTFLADQLSKIKSMLTVNTSPITQAVVGGKLIEHGGSLVAANERERATYAERLERLVSGLATRFDGYGRDTVSWTVPAGGFFVVVNVPFPVDDELLTRSARDYGVLWTPMHHFYDNRAAVRALRLSCSVATPAQIETGLDRLALLLKDELARFD